MIGEVASMFLPAAVNAVGKAVGGVANAASGNAAGRVAGAGLNANDVFERLREAGVTLDPEQQAKIQQKFDRENQEFNQQQSFANQAFGAQLGNQAGNLITEREMAVQAQRNAADNVRTQLDALARRSSDSANAINNAISTGINAFRG
ncbi:hypothetical protein PCC6912_39640 [Chlorogloeopsis fritschii PCC 6912]|uniref:Uncharacterized protein n=1 Tax=Chlorogloeopsis fritschii PCC 6912 TaxID=211165 RepID=A0A3S1FF95_CHLFR|nr:hypothetical protein [Chlorogloeopsis fritschii]RUR77005.1 hypothetical protein PCC6912_39640 [Chlorogloeopsis fritschii PCC 6912]